MSAPETRPDLTALLSTLDSQFDPSLPAPALVANLHTLENALLHTAVTTSLGIPFASLRACIQRTVSNSTPASVTLAAATLFLRLLAKYSLAYEELTLSTCLHHVTRVLKDAVGVKCPRKCDPKRSICTASTHVPLEEYKAFWVEFLALIRRTSFDIRSPGFVPLAVTGFADLVRYSTHSWYHDIVLSAVEAVLHQSDSRVTPLIYKTIFPVIRLTLPAHNRNTIAEIVIRAAKHELSDQTFSPLKSPPTRSAAASPEHPPHGNQTAPTPNTSRLPILRFLELCCIHVLDRADQRSSLSLIIVKVLQAIGEPLGCSFETFILKISRHPKGRVRLFAVEFTALLVANKVVGTRTDNPHVLGANRLVFVKMLAARANDRVPPVRVKAITSLTEAVKSIQLTSDPGLLDELVDIAFRLGGRLRDPKSRVRKAAVEYAGLVCLLFLSRHGSTSLGAEMEIVQESSNDLELPSVVERKFLSLVSLLKQRSSDAVSNVRLATAVQVTQMILNLSVSMSQELCQELVSLWCEVVLPHVEDVDPRCRDTCLKSIAAILNSSRSKMSPKQKEGERGVSSHSSKHLLDLFLVEIGSDNYAVAELGRKAIKAVCKSGCLASSEVNILCQKAISGESGAEELSQVQKGAWIALAEAANCGRAALVEKVLGYKAIIQEVTFRRNKSACRVTMHLVEFMTEKAREELSMSLKEILFSEDSFGKTAPCGDFLTSVVDLLSTVQEGVGSHLLDCCQKMLRDGMDDAQSEKLLLLIGSVCVSFQLSREPTKRILTFVQALASNCTHNSKTRALALTTLGKICLCEGTGKKLDGAGNVTVNTKRNGGVKTVNKIGEALTRRYVSVFVHELDNATSSATRNNAVLVLCDLCRQYTSVVEPYIARLAGLLSDPSEFIRIQVLSSLVSLLQEDYIKIRSGPIFYQVARCLLDSAEAVRATAEYALLHVISPKNPSMLATTFVELIFVLNNCTQCQVYNQSNTSPRGVRAFNTGCNDFEKRMQIYGVFLQGMTLEHRLRLPGRFRSDIISLVSDGKLPLSDISVQAVLSDTLNLLSCEQIRSVSPGLTSEDDNTVGDQSQDSVRTQIQKQSSSVDKPSLSQKMSLVSKVQTLELQETTIPALLEIRHHLEEARSPLLRVLMKSLCLLLQPHRNNLGTIVTDPVLRSEVQHQMSVAAKNSRAERRSSRGGKQASGKDRTEGSRPPKPGEKRNGGDSPCTVRGNLAKPVSVPRTRPSRKQRKLALSNSDSEEDAAVFGEDSDGSFRNRRLSTRIEASPKLAAIATRATRASSSEVFAINIDEKPSSFALALARIEDAATE